MSTENKHPFKLEEHSFRLLKNEPFFAALSRAVTKICNRSIPTAGVCVNPETAFFEMHYNPEFFENLGKTDENGNPITDAQKQLERREIESGGILKHEFYHLIYEHVTTRLPQEGMTYLWNIATDLAINSDIYKELPWSACVPGREYKDPKTGTTYPGFKDYPLGKSSEFYFEMLKKDPRAEEARKKYEEMRKQWQQNKQNGQGQQGGGGGQPGPDNGGMPGPLDDHEMWGDADEPDNIMNDIAKERLKQTLEDATNEVIRGGRGWGTVSAELQKEILRRLQSTVNWKSVLRYFVKTSQKADKQSTIRKINRRYPYIHAGRKTNRTAKVAISIDQSGSVGDAMLAAFFAELNKLSEYAEFTVIPFDDRVFVEKVYTWKKGEKKKWQRVLCGGTNFDAPTAYVNERQFDGHIILTDLCAPKPSNSKCQRMWLTTENCARNPYFKTHEKVIAIPDKDIRDFE